MCIRDRPTILHGVEAHTSSPTNKKVRTTFSSQKIITQSFGTEKGFCLWTSSLKADQLGCYCKVVTKLPCAIQNNALCNATSLHNLWLKIIIHSTVQISHHAIITFSSIWLVTRGFITISNKLLLQVGNFYDEGIQYLMPCFGKCFNNDKIL